MEKHKKMLKFGVSKSTGKSRVHPLTLENVEFFIKMRSELNVKILDNGSNLFNADEFLLTVSSNKEFKIVKLLDSDRKAHNTRAKRLNTVGSIIPFVGANGDVLFIAICIKGDEGKNVTFRLEAQKAVREHFKVPLLCPV
jgi:hypothetical protein